MSAGLEGLSMKLFIHSLGWTEEKVRAFLQRVEDEMKDRSIHAYWDL